MIKSEKINFDQLDLFRFIAAFMVIIAHGYEAWVGYFGVPGFMSNNDYKTFNPIGGYLNIAIHNLPFGVDIFFMISGFLITYILLAEKESSGTIDLKKFYIRRILRIWPLYYFLIAITPFLIWQLGEKPPHYLSTLLLYNNFHAITTQQWIYPFAHFWSICVEEHFYLFWPLLLVLVPMKRLPVFFFSVIFVSICFRFYTGVTNSSAWYIIYLHTLSRMDVLAMGALAAYYQYFKGFSVFPDRAIRWMLYMIFIVMIFYDPITAWDNLYLMCFKKYFYCAIAGMAMINYQFNPEASRLFKKRNMLYYFGKISYGIYMYGNILLLVIVKKIMWKFHLDNMYLFMFFVVSLSLLIPVISYELFEKQILKLKPRFQVVKTVDS